MSTIIALIVAYLLGSLSSSIILSKLLKFPDPRSQGSGNAGATNVLRTVGRNKAIAVLVGDILKGLIAVWVGRILGVHGALLGFVAAAAVAGHIFPIFFKFKGGKGVATMIGVIFALSFFVGVLTAVVWLVVAFIFRYASLASMAAAVGALILMLLLGKAMYAFPMFIIAGLVIWKHQDNIKRLRTGVETKIKF